MNKDFVLGDLLNYQYQYSPQYPNQYQTTYLDFKNHNSNHANSYEQNLIYSGEVIANQFIASRDLKMKFNLELSFIICNGYNICFIIFS